MTQQIIMDLTEEVKLIPMVLCHKDEGTHKIESTWYRKARDGEQPSLHKQRDYEDE